VVAPDAATGLYPPDSRHINIEQHCFIVNHAQTDEAVLSVACLAYIEAHDIKRSAQAASQRSILFYNQQSSL
jgi:hypothetical protein